MPLLDAIGVRHLRCSKSFEVDAISLFIVDGFSGAGERTRERRKDSKYRRYARIGNRNCRYLVLLNAGCSGRISFDVTAAEFWWEVRIMSDEKDIP